MKISIGLRLFSAVLLSIIAVASVSLLLMREKVSASFSDYALRIELDRLQEIGDALQEQYAMQKNWAFLPTDEADQRAWISQELLRLSDKRTKTRPPSDRAVSPPSAADSAASVSPVEKILAQKQIPKQTAATRPSAKISTHIIVTEGRVLTPTEN